MSSSSTKTLRLHFPQWQGGNNHAYFFGAELLAWLAPESNDPVEKVSVSFDEQTVLNNENGIVGRQVLIQQITESSQRIARHQPDNLVVLGGDCLVDLAPFAYLSEKYQDKLGVLWVDAHPDIMTPEQFSHAHAMVLRALMGEGDSDLTQFVTTPIKASKIFYAGVNEESEYEAQFLASRHMRVSRPEAIRSGDYLTALQQWIAEEKIECLAIHLDLDVLSTASFGSLLFRNPHVPEGTYAGIAQGKLTIAEVLGVISQAAAQAQVVGLGIAEHLPWDSLNLKKMLAQLPLLSR